MFLPEFRFATTHFAYQIIRKEIRIVKAITNQISGIRDYTTGSCEELVYLVIEPIWYPPSVSDGGPSLRDFARTDSIRQRVRRGCHVQRIEDALLDKSSKRAGIC
jgi:hypothetical protein